MPLNESSECFSSDEIISIIETTDPEKINNILGALGSVISHYLISENLTAKIENLNTELTVLNDAIPKNDLTVLFEWLGFKFEDDNLKIILNIETTRARAEVFFKLAALRRDTINYKKSGCIDFEDKLLQHLNSEGMLEKALYAEGTVAEKNGRSYLRTIDGRSLYNDSIFSDFRPGEYLRVFRFNKHTIVRKETN